MSPLRLPAIPRPPELSDHLGFDALRARAVDLLAAPAVRPRVERSRAALRARDRFGAADLGAALGLVEELARTRRAAALHPLLPVVADGGREGSARLAAVARAGEAAITALAGAGTAGVPGAGAPEVYLEPEHLGVGVHPDAGQVLTELCRAGEESGVGVMLRTGRPEQVAALLDAADAARTAHPGVGVSLLARRHRAEDDCARLVAAGARVRLVRGGPRESRATSWRDPHEADLAFVRALATLLKGGGELVVATHDPLLLDLTDALATQAGRRPREVEHQMYLGVQPQLQVRSADAGHPVRVLVPYAAGSEGWAVEGWVDYLRDLLERPATASRLAQVILGRG